MVTKEMIQEQLDNLTEEQINQVYDLIENLSTDKKSLAKPSLMSKLQQIEIDALKISQLSWPWVLGEMSVSHKIFVDTWFIVALINKRDQYHQKAVELAKQYNRSIILWLLLMQFYWRLVMLYQIIIKKKRLS